MDSILDKESYSLEELLDEDELIQECKSLNARLTAYLKQRDTVEKLVGGGGWAGQLLPGTGTGALLAAANGAVHYSCTVRRKLLLAASPMWLTACCTCA